MLLFLFQCTVRIRQRNNLQVEVILPRLCLCNLVPKIGRPMKRILAKAWSSLCAKNPWFGVANSRLWLSHCKAAGPPIEWSKLCGQYRATGFWVYFQLISQTRALPNLSSSRGGDCCRLGQTMKLDVFVCLFFNAHYQINSELATNECTKIWSTFPIPRFFQILEFCFLFLVQFQFLASLFYLI